MENVQFLTIVDGHEDSVSLMVNIQPGMEEELGKVLGEMKLKDQKIEIKYGEMTREAHYENNIKSVMYGENCSRVEAIQIIAEGNKKATRARLQEENLITSVMGDKIRELDDDREYFKEQLIKAFELLRININNINDRDDELVKSMQCLILDNQHTAAYFKSKVNVGKLIPGAMV